MSTSEMVCFIRYVGVNYWKFNSYFQQILEAVYITDRNNINSKIKRYSLGFQWINLIEENHSLYLELFNISLKPKHYNMVHYLSIIKEVGPLAYISSFRFESKHRLGKKQLILVHLE